MCSSDLCDDSLLDHPLAPFAVDAVAKGGAVSTAAGGGRELFRTKLTDPAPNTSGYACSSVGSPISFVGQDGKQRIAVPIGAGLFVFGLN